MLAVNQQLHNTVINPKVPSIATNPLLFDAIRHTYSDRLLCLSYHH